MKVIQAKTNKTNLLYSSIDLELTNKDADEIKEQAAQILLENIVIATREGISSVTGSKFPALKNKDYKEFKQKEVGTQAADLTFSGDLLNALGYRITDKGFDIGYFSSEEAAKADGHNNFSGKSKLPTRKFLPEKNENFTANIQKQVEDYIAINDKLASRDEDFANVNDRGDLYQLLSDVYPSLTKNQIKEKIITDKDLFFKLMRLGVLQFL